uniref:NAD-dependent epimerase/dehydratase family protein n=1 Tax=Agathobacter sp. TaxID=2021311 RepID=UPI00405634BB
MKILILGGTGAMGTALVEILSEGGNEVYVTSRNSRTSCGNVHYIQGNAHDNEFIRKILSEHYDVIVDFMVYASEEFRSRADMFLNSAGQYIFLSSSRVYSDAGNKAITEETVRLLDSTDDREYLKKDEYALAKAREENILFQSGRKNWTIIRPYITYNVERLQLGVYEKEAWLYRALHGRSIVFSKDIAKRYTTLTYGYDVAKTIAALIGNEKAYGEAFHIAAEQSLKWEEILNVYLDSIESEKGFRPKVLMVEDSAEIGKVLGNKYQIKYDRLYNRHFSSKKVKETIGETIVYTEVYNGLRKCLTAFMREERKFLAISPRREAYFDKLAGEHTPISEFGTLRAKIVYIAARYMGIM